MPNFDPRKAACFHSLPTIVQESIMQSNVTFYSEEEVKEFAQRYMESNTNTPIQ